MVVSRFYKGVKRTKWKQGDWRRCPFCGDVSKIVRAAPVCCDKAFFGGNECLKPLDAFGDRGVVFRGEFFDWMSVVKYVHPGNYVLVKALTGIDEKKQRVIRENERELRNLYYRPPVWQKEFFKKHTQAIREASGFVGFGGRGVSCYEYTWWVMWVNCVQRHVVLFEF